MIGAAVVGYFKYTQEQMAELNREIATKEFALKAAEATMEQQKRDLEKQAEVLKKTNEEFQAARNAVADLEDKFTKKGRDFGAFTSTKPAEAETRVNSATVKTFRCIEDVVNKGVENAKDC
jgi:chromosome segregation ATPase